MIITTGNQYRNKKNGLLYRVNAIVRHHETLEYNVVYEALYDTTLQYRYWVREVDSFIEKFEEVDSNAVL